MFTRGLAWCQVPIGYSLSLIFGTSCSDLRAPDSLEISRDTYEIENITIARIELIRKRTLAPNSSRLLRLSSLTSLSVLINVVSDQRILGALLFVRPMRKAEYVTMLDPFQERYGAGIGGLLFLPALCGDLFWCGAVLRALGSSLAVVAGVDPNISVCASALLAAM